MGECGHRGALIGPTVGGKSTAALQGLSTLRSIADAVLAVLLAPTCLACHAPITTPLSGPVCQACWNGVQLVPPPLCATCGDTLVGWRIAEASLGCCTRCRRRGAIITLTRSAGLYEGTLRAAIHGLKYDGFRSLAEPLATLMRVHAESVLKGADAVVPVPLHGARRRARGFNQATDLARRLGLPLVHALSRIRATQPQAELPAAQRHSNVRSAFVPTRAITPWRGAVVVLVDDVCTTGATLDACARVLLNGGVTEVRAITAARAVRSRP